MREDSLTPEVEQEFRRIMALPIKERPVDLRYYPYLWVTYFIWLAIWLGLGSSRFTSIPSVGSLLKPGSLKITRVNVSGRCNLEWKRPSSSVV